MGLSRVRGRAGIEARDQALAVAPAMTIVENLLPARGLRREGVLGSVLTGATPPDRARCRAASAPLRALGGAWLPLHAAFAPDRDLFLKV